MNKDLIKKYKAEFEHWLEDGKLLASVQTSIWTNCNDCAFNWVNPGSIEHIIINDKYVEFRKAQAEGKIIQYNTGIHPQTWWIDISNSSFSYAPEMYRVRPEKKFKVGDFVRRTGYTTIFKVNSICNEFLHANTSEHYSIENMELWEPKKGEWVIFNICDDSFSVARYITMENNMYSLENTPYLFDYVEPFLGTLPKTT